MKISIIIPVFQGERTVSRLVDALFSQYKEWVMEVILVNDGSTDNSKEVCLSIFKRYPDTVKFIDLSRNFGEHNAVLAGLSYSSGDFAVVIDDDFQNPPEEIRKLVDAAVSGKYDVVYSYYDRKCHSWFRNLGSRFNNLVANLLLDKPKDLYLSSFKCINRFMINEIIKYRGPYPYIDGLILRSTQNISKVLVCHQERKEGKSGYSFSKLSRLWLNMLVNFSVYPLRLSAYLGFLFSIIGGGWAVYAVIDKITHPDIPVGFTSIMVSILLFSGIQLIILGLMGEYLGKQYLTNTQTPQYVIRQIISADKQGELRKNDKS